VVSNASASVSSPAPNPKPTQQTVVNQPIIERVVETTRIVTEGGITEALLDARLLALTNDLSSRMNQLALASTHQTNTVYNTVSAALRIEDLTGLTAHDLTVDGVTGLADADLPDSLTASNYLALSGGSITGDLAIGGTLSASTLAVAGISSGGAIEAPYFTATSSTATSTFAGGVSGPGSFTVQSSSGRVGIGTTTPQNFLDVGNSTSPGARDIAVYATGNSGSTAGIKFITHGVPANSYIKQDSFGAYSSGTGSVGHGLNLASGRSGFSSFFFRNSSDNVGVAIVDPAAGAEVTSLPFAANLLVGGNVGIGTTTPNAKLEVASASDASVPTIRISGFNSNAGGRMGKLSFYENNYSNSELASISLTRAPSGGD